MKINSIQYRDLSFYSFEQIRERPDGSTSRETFLNKVTIKPNDDVEDGYEVLIYGFVNDKFEVCNGLRQTSILLDCDDEVQLQGKGRSGNGIPLNNMTASIKWNDGYASVKLRKENINDSNTYHNCCSHKAISFSSIGEEDIDDLLIFSSELSTELSKPEDRYFYVIIKQMLLSIKEFYFRNRRDDFYVNAFLTHADRKRNVSNATDFLEWHMDNIAWGVYNGYKETAETAHGQKILDCLCKMNAINLLLKTFVYKERECYYHGLF